MSQASPADLHALHLSHDKSDHKKCSECVHCISECCAIQITTSATCNGDGRPDAAHLHKTVLCKIWARRAVRRGVHKTHKTGKIRPPAWNINLPGLIFRAGGSFFFGPRQGGREAIKPQKTAKTGERQFAVDRGSNGAGNAGVPR